MMKARQLFLVVFFSMVFVSVFAKEPTKIDRKNYNGVRKIKNNAFKTGEWIEFRIHYGPITAGKAYLEVKSELTDFNGRKCYHIVGKGRSAKSFDWIYKVDDRYETIMDVEGLFPWRFKRKIREGGFRKYTEVVFDHFKKQAFEANNHNQEIKKYKVPTYIQDALSTFYYSRTKDYSNAKVGQVFHFENFLDREVHDFDVEYLGKTTIKVGAGKFKVVKLKPKLVEGGIFMHKGDMFLYVSDDENKLPVRIEADLVVGSIKVDLNKVKNVKNPMKAKI